MTKEELVEKYKAIYKRKTGKDLSDQDALEQATKLITLVKAVYRPIPKSEETERRVDKAYDILFDEVSKRQDHGNPKRDDS